MAAPAERAVLGPRRSSLVGDLTGRVMDVGAGTGANLPHYRRAAEVIAVEPDPAMRRRLAERASTCPVPVTVSEASGDRLPADGDSVDAVVFTLVLCTVPDPARALVEARRVLRPGGSLVAIEHVLGHGRPAVWCRRLATGKCPGQRSFVVPSPKTIIATRLATTRTAIPATPPQPPRAARARTTTALPNARSRRTPRRKLPSSPVRIRRGGMSGTIAISRWPGHPGPFMRQSCAGCRSKQTTFIEGAGGTASEARSVASPRSCLMVRSRSVTRVS